MYLSVEDVAALLNISSRGIRKSINNYEYKLVPNPNGGQAVLSGLAWFLKARFEAAISSAGMRLCSFSSTC